MQDGFQAIDNYLSLCTLLGQDSFSSEMLTADQKVPEQNSTLINRDVMLCEMPPACDESSINYMPMDDMMALDAFGPPDPARATDCTYTCEMTDQTVNGSESPRTIMDLDRVSGYEDSMYDDKYKTMSQVKQEVQYLMDCTQNNQINAQHVEQVTSSQLPDENNIVECKSLLMSFLHQVDEDIATVCNDLRISRDPRQWSAHDVQLWITKQERQHCLPTTNLEYFQMSGAELCSLSEEQFKQRSPRSGSLLYSQLEFWKSVLNSSPIPAQPQIKSEFVQVDCVEDYSDMYGIPAPSVSPAPSSGSESEDSLSSIMSTSPQSHTSFGSLSSTDDELSSYFRSPIHETRTEDHEQRQTIHLWQFLKEQLNNSEEGHSIKWLDRARGIFKIEDSNRVAKLWGKRKNRPAMNYDKLSRSIRQYYKKGIIKKTETSKRLVYQFCVPYL